MRPQALRYMWLPAGSLILDVASTVPSLAMSERKGKVASGAIETCGADHTPSSPFVSFAVVFMICLNSLRTSTFCACGA